MSLCVRISKNLEWFCDIHLPKQMRSQIRLLRTALSFTFTFPVSRIKKGSGKQKSKRLFLFKNNINNIVRDGIEKVSRNRVSVQFGSAQDANSLLMNRLLNTNKFTASIFAFYITRMEIGCCVWHDMYISYLSVELLAKWLKCFFAFILSRKFKPNDIISY